MLIVVWGASPTPSARLCGKLKFKFFPYLHASYGGSRPGTHGMYLTLAMTRTQRHVQLPAATSALPLL